MTGSRYSPVKVNGVRYSPSKSTIDAAVTADEGDADALALTLGLSEVEGETLAEGDTLADVDTLG